MYEEKSIKSFFFEETSEHTNLCNLKLLMLKKVEIFMTFLSIYEHPRLPSHANLSTLVSILIGSHVELFSPKLDATSASNCEDMSKQTFRLIS